MYVSHCVKQRLASRKSQISHGSRVKCINVFMANKRTSGMLMVYFYSAPKVIKIIGQTNTMTPFYILVFILNVFLSHTLMFSQLP